MAGLLDNIEDSDNTIQEEPPVVDVGANSEVGLDSNEGLTFNTLEVGGVKIEGETIEDGLGNTWQVPGGNVDDLDDLYAGDVYKIPAEITDKFHVQLIRKDQLQEYLMRQFVPITLKELKLPVELLKTGSPLDGYHVVGDAILMKIPHAINNRIQARKEKEVRDRLMALEPDEAQMKKAGIDAGLMVEHRLGFTPADPGKRQGIFANEQGKVG